MGLSFLETYKLQRYSIDKSGYILLLQYSIGHLLVVAINQSRLAIGSLRKHLAIVHLFISEANTHTLCWNL